MTEEGRKIFGGGRLENIARIAKAALHKLPEKSCLNTNSIFSVRPVCPVFSVCLSFLSVFWLWAIDKSIRCQYPPSKKLAFKWRCSTGTTWFVNIGNNVSGHNPSFLSTLTLPPALKRGQFECRDQFWTRLLSILSFWYTSCIKASNKRIDFDSCLLIIIATPYPGDNSLIIL